MRARKQLVSSGKLCPVHSLRRLVDVDVPLIQAPLAGAQDHRLAAAVGLGGGLGSLPAAMLSPEQLAAELAALAAVLAGRPFNVNFFCHEPPRPVDMIEQAWRATLAPYYAELGLDPATVTQAAARRPFDHDAADVLAVRPPALVSFHFGLPSEELVARVRSWGTRVLSSATTVAEAVWLERRGVDGVIAQGLEAGGHRGDFLGESASAQRTTIELVKAITATVETPVIAAGGLATAGDVAAALAAGAVAAQVGTAFLCCDEATTSAVHRSALRERPARETALTNLFTGRLARGLVNRLMRELGPVSDRVPAFPLAAAALAPLRTAAETRGSDDFSPLWAGTRRPLHAGVPAAVVLAALTP